MKPTRDSRPRRGAQKKRQKRNADPPAKAVPAASQAVQATKNKAPWRMRSARRLVRAIFARRDPVEVASALLDSKSDTTRTKCFFDLLAYLYGKPAQATDANGPEAEPGFQFVTYAPRPDYAVDPDSEDQRNKKACRESLAGAPGAKLRDGTHFRDVTQEDEHD